MKFAIVSDTHDNLANFKKVINWLNHEKIKVILHCGDICNQETINEALKNFKGEIKFVRGNGDFDLNDIPEKMEIKSGVKKIAFVHYPKIAKEMAESGKYDIVFYGHTHRPWLDRRSFSEGGEEKIKECLLVNPGEVAGQRFKPTFAVYDTETDKLELKILEQL
ncbi:MAG: metallophosphoesterase [Candidatus Staskawiczbacteria bacterium]|nr:metallophosphoesterase [Candidatus Staskawiczbacteria bacterium]MBI3337206.1 metallophosphoesterase [Candidatus Staskawiczbacteria bacterium]